MTNNKSIYLTRQQKMLTVSILNLRLEELKKWDVGIVEMYMFDITIGDIIKKLKNEDDATN